MLSTNHAHDGIDFHFHTRTRFFAGGGCCCRCWEERRERREKVVRRPDIFRTRHDPRCRSLAITQATPRVIGARMIDGPFQRSSPVRGTSASWNFAIRFRRRKLVSPKSKVGNDWLSIDMRQRFPRWKLPVFCVRFFRKKFYLGWRRYSVQYHLYTSANSQTYDICMSRSQSVAPLAISWRSCRQWEIRSV